MENFFIKHLDIVLFTYGTLFFILGTAISSQPRAKSEFRLADILWLLAGFCFTRGLNQFMDMWALIKGSGIIFDSMRFLALIVSYLFLFEFGRRLFSLVATGKPYYKKFLGPFLFLFPFLAVSVIAVRFILFPLDWNTVFIMARYFFGVPSGVLTGLAFIFYYRFNRQTVSDIKEMKGYLLAAGVCFFFYGILGGVIVPKGNFGFSTWLNTESFLTLFKFPAHLLRGFFIMVASWAVCGILRIFNWETQESLKSSASAIEIINRQLHSEIAHRKKAEEELYKTKQFLDDIVNGITEQILLISKDFQVLWANKTFLNQYSCKMDEVSGSYCYALTHNRQSPCQPPHDICPMTQVIKTGVPAKEVHLHSGPKGKSYSEVIVYPIKDQKGEIVEFVHIARDITEYKELEEKLKTLASHDELTDCINFRASMEILEKEIARSRRYKKEFAIIMLDLDDFKKYNDEYGHQAGNDILVAFANVLKDSLRAIDSICRYGGEEFLLILPETDGEHALVLMERVKGKLGGTRMISRHLDNKNEISLKFSAGIAVFSKNIKDLNELIRISDNALLKAKKEGKNRVILAQET